MAAKYYRTLFRKIIRLPLDRTTLERLRTNARSQFLNARNTPTYSVLDRKSYDKCIAIMDEVLERKYKSLRQLLDLVYKPKDMQEPWVREFQHIKYTALKKVWPQVHLIDEFGDGKSIALYHQQLKRLQLDSEFSIMHELGMDEPADVLVPLLGPPRMGREKLQQFKDKYTKFHSFISRNASRLLGLKIRPMEVLYEPNRYGLPESVTIRESKLKHKINYAKKLLEDFRAIREPDLRRLIQFIESDEGINPKFYRSSIRQKCLEDGTISPLVRKHVRQKSLVPNERNIKFYYRQYVETQFYVSPTNEYELSPKKNFYK